MLAIKFYETMPSDDENVIAGISPKIPVMIVDIDLFPNYSIDETFKQMTEQEFNDYMVSIQPELDAWKIIQATIPPTVEE